MGTAHINIVNGDYVVFAMVRDVDGMERYKPIINFGDRQSDAKDFISVDINSLTPINLINRARNYNGISKKRLGVLNYRNL